MGLQVATVSQLKGLGMYDKTTRSLWVYTPAKVSFTGAGAGAGESRRFYSVLVACGKDVVL